MVRIQTDSGFLVVGRIEESIDRLLARLTLSVVERAHYEKIGSPTRRREWLTWHAMLREVSGEGVSTDYAADGSPILVGCSDCISVSHSRKFVALYGQPGRCGVDIEDVTRDFEGVSPRFISPPERALCEASAIDHFFALMWCTKEAVYKYAGRPGLDLMRDIRVIGIDPAAEEIHVEWGDNIPVRLKYKFWEGHCLVYTVNR